MIMYLALNVVFPNSLLISDLTSAELSTILVAMTYNIPKCGKANHVAPKTVIKHHTGTYTLIIRHQT